MTKSGSDTKFLVLKLKYQLPLFCQLPQSWFFQTAYHTLRYLGQVHARGTLGFVQAGLQVIDE